VYLDSAKNGIAMSDENVGSSINAQAGKAAIMLRYGLPRITVQMNVHQHKVCFCRRLSNRAQLSLQILLHPVFRSVGTTATPDDIDSGSGRNPAFTIGIQGLANRGFLGSGVMH